MGNIIEKLGITPGPWEADGPGFIGPVDKPIIECGGSSADCYLISAAPEMLEAIIGHFLTMEIGTILSRQEEKMFDSILKATGKSWEELRRLLDE